jgi:hypothetical protein
MILSGFALKLKRLIVLSEYSVASRWVEREVNAARERGDRENRAVLFPIRIDDAVMDAKQPWASQAAVPHRRFPKMENHDAYEKAFERLLRDLRSGAAERRSQAVTGSISFAGPWKSAH